MNGVSAASEVVQRADDRQACTYVGFKQEAAIEFPGEVLESLIIFIGG